MAASESSSPASWRGRRRSSERAAGQLCSGRGGGGVVLRLLGSASQQVAQRACAEAGEKAQGHAPTVWRPCCWLKALPVARPPARLQADHGAVAAVQRARAAHA
jgi:hypothetical protein